jgi:eukaryotic-like serine/threonine-protein kinase
MGPKDNDRDDATLEAPGDPRDATPTVGSPRSRAIRPAGPLQVGKRYSIGEVIARGGMGEVVHAVDEQIGRPVAIKRMIDAEPNDVDVERFLREARIQARLDHPAIVPVYELARDVDGRPFFAMKRLSGRTLDEVLDAHANRNLVALARFPRQRLLRAFADVCLAMEYAHERGIVHRDLKPTNIMLGDFGEVYVIDWGIARIAGETEPVETRAVTAAEGVTQPGTRLGTPGYMSPEQIEKPGDIDGRADVYALGCILFEILAGKALHPTGPAGMISATEGRDARPSQAAPDHDIPPELDQVCVEATMRDRDTRLRSARELGERVHHYLDGDRDLIQRQRLAREHLAHASDALTGGGGDDANRTATAMREAGRALVLDPTVVEAADLVRRLMAEAPSITPPEVQREIETADALAHKQFARLSLVAYLGYLLFLPILMLLGVRDYFYFYAMLGVIAANGVIAWFGMRGWRSPIRTVLVVLVHGAMAALLTRMFSLVIVAPGAVAVTLMALVAHPTYTKRWRTIAAVGFVIVAMLAPFFAELAGLLSRTIEIVGDSIVIHPVAVHQVPGLIETTFVLWTASLVAMASAMAWVNARRERSNRLLLRVQAWRLRQLVPDIPAAPLR